MQENATISPSGASQRLPTLQLWDGGGIKLLSCIMACWIPSANFSNFGYAGNSSMYITYTYIFYLFFLEYRYTYTWSYMHLVCILCLCFAHIIYHMYSYRMVPPRYKLVYQPLLSQLNAILGGSILYKYRMIFIVIFLIESWDFSLFLDEFSPGPAGAARHPKSASQLYT